jgi:hypothetical protein
MESIKCSNCETENQSNSKYCKNCGKELPKVTIETKIEAVPTPANKLNKSKLLGVIFSVVGGIIGYLAVQFLFFSKPSFDKVMMETANTINQSCPIMIDKATRLDNTLALPEKVFQYNYTLVELTKAEIQIEELRKYLEPNILNNAKTNPDMKFCRDNKATFDYYYKDKNGEFVFEYKVTPEMYE